MKNNKERDATWYEGGGEIKKCGPLRTQAQGKKTWARTLDSLPPKTIKYLKQNPAPSGHSSSSSLAELKPRPEHFKMSLFLPWIRKQNPKTLISKKLYKSKRERRRTIENENKIKRMRRNKRLWKPRVAFSLKKIFVHSKLDALQKKPPFPLEPCLNKGINRVSRLLRGKGNVDFC